MAVQTTNITSPQVTRTNLIQKLARVLPKDVSFRIYHLSTPPTRSSAIYSARPGKRSDRTYCENHFLTVSVNVPANHNSSGWREVLAFALEILVYSTAYDTTFFISKADSTGYLHLLGLPNGTPSPIRNISSTFLRHLIDTHQRPYIRSVVSLFARAQGQYLFPGSVEYAGKHILDDRGLVRWWCRVLDPIIDEAKAEAVSQWNTVNGHLIIPGMDHHETLSHVPRQAKLSWSVGHPLLEISRYTCGAPPRCMIPRFPDDPKARFLDELDEEISKSSSLNGKWKSVRSIEQFWEMMAFRQECSAGRLVGFIWIVFHPKSSREKTKSLSEDYGQTACYLNSEKEEEKEKEIEDFRQSEASYHASTSFRGSSQLENSSLAPRNAHSERKSPNNSVRASRSWPLQSKKLTGPIVPRQARVKTSAKKYIHDGLESTPYYIWCPQGRGQVVLNQSDYKRVTELLLCLDFADIELASSSSTRWINEVRSEVWAETKEAWGQTVTGTKAVTVRSEMDAAGGLCTLNDSLVCKKRKSPEDPESSDPMKIQVSPQVKILPDGIVRKKSKV